MAVKTVQAVTLDLLRALDLTTIFGNPGSTEEPFLQNLPSDFKYILALQENSAVAMADGYAQRTGRPAFLNLHTSAGMANAMANLMTAYLNKTPLIVTAGQQTREMILSEPLLTNRDECMLPRPWVKWSYQPVRAEDVPAAIMRAYAIALQPPAGPVFLSIPFDDWERPALGPAAVRSVSHRVGPDPDRIKEFAERISNSKNPVLVYGAEVDRNGAWDEAVEFAELIQAPVFAAPFMDRAVFPENHIQYQRILPPAIAPICKLFEGHDLVVVIGAPVFRYYPYVEGDYVPKGTELLQITADPFDAGAAPIGDSLISDSKLALEQLLTLTKKSGSKKTFEPHKKPELKNKDSASPMPAEQLFKAISEVKPDDAIIVQETISNGSEVAKWLPNIHPYSYYSFASGGLGWGAPAAVGIALAEKKKSKPAPVVALIGDGSFQYAVQNIYTAVQQKAKVIYVIPCNGEYAVLKSFANLEQTPNVPALNIPGLDINSLAKGYGCHAVSAKSVDEVKAAFKEALKADGPSIITVPIESGFLPIVPEQSKVAASKK